MKGKWKQEGGKRWALGSGQSSRGFSGSAAPADARPTSTAAAADDDDDDDDVCEASDTLSNKATRFREQRAWE